MKNQMIPKMSNHCQLNQQNCLNYTQSRFNHLSQISEEVSPIQCNKDAILHKCQGWNFTFETKGNLEDHKRSAHVKTTYDSEGEEVDKDKKDKRPHS